MLTKKSPSKAKQSTTATKKASSATSSKQPQTRTRILVKYDVGFSNSLYIRGKGPSNLNWDRGIPLKNLKADEWIWETEAKFSQGEFKVLINDQTFEIGPNHSLKPGSDIEFTPRF